MSDAIEFDSSKYTLGNLCRRGHDFFGTGQSIRYRLGSHCVDCETKSRPYLGSRAAAEWPQGFNESKLYLGKLCRNRHGWNSSGFSLRYKSKKEGAGSCVECSREKHARNYKPHPKPTKQENLIDGKFYLGDLCKRGHAYNGLQQSLRRLGDRGCVACEKEIRQNFYQARDQELWSERTLIDAQVDYDSRIHYIGRICKNGHSFQGMLHSVRRIGNRDCVACRSDRYQEQREEILETRKHYYQDNRENILKQKSEYYRRNIEKKTEYNRRYAKANHEALLEAKRNYYHRNKMLMRSRYKAWRESDRGRLIHRMHGIKRHATKKSVHSSAWSPEEIQSLMQLFGNCCAYCGVSAKLALDHFIPLSKGGPNCIGNLIPTCKSCNSSKRDKDPKEWFARHPNYSIRGWRKILKVLGKSESNYNQIPLL